MNQDFPYKAGWAFIIFAIFLIISSNMVAFVERRYGFGAGQKAKKIINIAIIPILIGVFVAYIFSIGLKQ